MKTLTRKPATLLSTALLTLFLSGMQPAMADGDMPHNKKDMKEMMKENMKKEGVKKEDHHKLSENSESDPLFEKLPEGHSDDKHDIGNSEYGVANEELPKSNNKDGHHDVNKKAR